MSDRTISDLRGTLKTEFVIGPAGQSVTLNVYAGDLSLEFMSGAFILTAVATIPDTPSFLIGSDGSQTSQWYDAAATRGFLGLTVGTDVQAYSATLAAITAGTWTGASSITTLGTIGTGVWNATAIALAKVDITGATANTAPDDADTVPHYDTSATANKKVTIADLRKLFTPPGMISQFGGTTAPSGWLECDGSAVSRTTYADLFSAIGTTYGAGNGTTTFNLPAQARRALVGRGGTGTGTLGNAVGNTGGAETHTLSSGEMPAHTHGPHSSAQFLLQRNNGGGLSFNVTTGAGALDGFLSTTGSTGGGGAHNNIQPSLVVMFIIKT